MFLEQTYENIKKRILEKFPFLLDKREGSYSDTLISPVSEELAKAYIDMGDILSLGFIETNFDEYLDRRVAEFGVYRKLGKKSIGEITVTGEAGATISNGTYLMCNDLKYVVLNDMELPTSDIIHVEAVEVGKQYNVIKGSIFKLIDPNNNVKSLVAKNNFEGGIDIETDEELRNRFVKVVNNPSTSGNPAHYEQWALEVDGVGRAIVYPLWDKSNGMNGNGTVKVMCIGSDGNPIDSTIIENVKLHILENKPIGCTLTVTTPSILNIVIVATIELKDGYTIEDVKIDFEQSVNEYLKSVTSEVVYSKIYGLMINLLGVGDIASLTINGATSNIEIANDKIPKLSSAEISEVA